MNKIFAIVAMAVTLSACGPNPVPVDANGVPQAVQQQGGGFDAGSAAIGAVGGAVLGHMMTKNSQTNHPRTIVVDRPTYARSPYYGGSSTVTRTTTVKKSMFGNKVTRTTTTTRRR